VFVCLVCLFVCVAIALNGVCGQIDASACTAHVCTLRVAEHGAQHSVAALGSR
jgi:hypothetical protein